MRKNPEDINKVKTKDNFLYQVNLWGIPVGMERGIREFLSTIHKLYDQEIDPSSLSDHEKWIFEFLQVRSEDLWSEIPKFDISEKGDW